IENKQAMETCVADFRKKLSVIKQSGNEKAKKRHAEQGKLLPRQRLEKLLDTDADFLELSAFAGYELYDDIIPAGGIITGIGKICGQECMIIINDATVKGGAYYPITVKKH